MSGEQADSEILRDLAGRIFRNTSPSMGFDQADSDFLYRIAGLLPIASALAGLVEEMLDNLKHCSLSSGCCHCGDSMDKHADPMCCGHTPVDMGWTAAESWIAKAVDAIAKAKGEA